MSIFNARKGSSLAESMVALGLVMMGLLGIVVLYTRSLALNRDVVNQTIAAGLAAEGIEVVKNIIDTNIAERGSDEWRASFDAGTYQIDYESSVSGVPLPPFSGNGTPLTLEDATGLYARAGGDEATFFTRRVAIEFPSETEIQVNAIVEWNERGETKTLNVEDIFRKWRP